MTAVLAVRLNDLEIARIESGDVPCERTPSHRVEKDAVIVFEDGAGTRHTHPLGNVSGWAHFSIRVHKGLACQPDCVIGNTETFDPQALPRGEAIGIRFQPFFLAGAAVDMSNVRGQGLFKRGLHFSGRITQGGIRLACECDACGKSFMVQPFHAGFSQCTYFYSDSSRHTLTIDDQEMPSRDRLRDPAAREAFERTLPPAPDGTHFRYLNPFRCPHCGAPYIDFARHPELRETEYYGNTLFGTSTIRFSPPHVPPPKTPKRWWRGLFGR